MWRSELCHHKPRNAKDGQQTTEARAEAQNRFSLTVSEGINNAAVMISDFIGQNPERIHFCRFVKAVPANWHKYVLKFWNAIYGII